MNENKDEIVQAIEELARYIRQLNRAFKHISEAYSIVKNIDEPVDVREEHAMIIDSIESLIVNVERAINSAVAQIGRLIYAKQDT